MLKKGTRVELYSPELSRSQTFEASHAAAILGLQVNRKTATWVLPEGSRYIYEDGEIKPSKVRKSSKKS